MNKRTCFTFLFLVALADVARAGQLDPGAPAAPAEVNLAAGRTTRVPVSWSFKTSFRRTGPHQIIARGRCTSGDAALLIDVTALADGRPLGTFYNDDNQGDDQPILRGPSLTGGALYTLYAFSRRRGTSRCEVTVTTASATESFGVHELGGTILDLGPLRAGDFVEVRSETNGFALPDDTELVAFEVPHGCTGKNNEVCASTHAALTSLDAVPSDRDPRIAFPNDITKNRMLALVSRTHQVGGSVRFPESMLDVVRGPVENPTAANSAAFPQEGGAGDAVFLMPGRYYLWLFAETDTPTGSFLRELNDNDGLTSNCRKSSVDSRLARGALNEHLFDARVERVFSLFDEWKTVAERRVARGALGTDPKLAAVMNRVILEVEVQSPAFYRIAAKVTDDSEPDLRFGKEWGFARNPDAGELKVATLNMWYGDWAGRTGYEYQNAADLLARQVGTRDHDPVIEEDIDRSPFEWEADIVSLTELDEDTDDVGSPYREAILFLYEAAAGRAGWTHTIGMSEYNDWNYGWAATFVNSTAYPNGSPADVTWPLTNIRPPSCTGPQGGEDATHESYIRCYLPVSESEGAGHWVDTWAGTFWTETNNYTIPARAASQRLTRDGGHGDVPVGVFTIHYNSGGQSGQDDRITETMRTADVMEAFLRTTPESFNRDHSSDPKNRGNRFIVIGDTNAHSHDCGEHYSMLRALRERFGYAVDAALAVDESFALGSGMHNYSADLARIGGTLFPVPYVPRREWGALTSGQFDVFVEPRPDDPAFPWYARTFRGDTEGTGYGGDRHDIIFLVGQGWASDDPVRDYRVMQDTTNDSPYSVHLRGEAWGVGMFSWSSGQGSIEHGGMNYRPWRHAGNGGEAVSGDPALITDHRPVGARLRIFTERNER